MSSRSNKTSRAKGTEKRRCSVSNRFPLRSKVNDTWTYSCFSFTNQVTVPTRRRKKKQERTKDHKGIPTMVLLCNAHVLFLLQNKGLPIIIFEVHYPTSLQMQSHQRVQHRQLLHRICGIGPSYGVCISRMSMWKGSLASRDPFYFSSLDQIVMSFKTF